MTSHLDQETKANLQKNLFSICAGGDHSAFQKWSKTHAKDIMLYLNIKQEGEEGNTPLIFAIKANSCSLVEQLLKKGSFPNQLNNQKQSPLFIAAWNGNSKICEILLEYKANVNLQDQQKWTPLIIASYSGHIETVRILLQYNADINLIDNYGKKALQRAKDPCIIRELLNHQNYINTRSNSSNRHLKQQQQRCGKSIDLQQQQQQKSQTSLKESKDGRETPKESVNQQKLKKIMQKISGGTEISPNSGNNYNQNNKSHNLSRSNSQIKSLNNSKSIQNSPKRKTSYHVLNRTSSQLETKSKGQPIDKKEIKQGNKSFHVVNNNSNQNINLDLQQKQNKQIKRNGSHSTVENQKKQLNHSMQNVSSSSKINNYISQTNIDNYKKTKIFGSHNNSISIQPSPAGESQQIFKQQNSNNSQIPLSVSVQPSPYRNRKVKEDVKENIRNSELQTNSINKQQQQIQQQQQLQQHQTQIKKDFEIILQEKINAFQKCYEHIQAQQEKLQVQRLLTVEGYQMQMKFKETLKEKFANIYSDVYLHFENKVQHIRKKLDLHIENPVSQREIFLLIQQKLENEDVMMYPENSLENELCTIEQKEIILKEQQQSNLQELQKVPVSKNDKYSMQKGEILADLSLQIEDFVNKNEEQREKRVKLLFQKSQFQDLFAKYSQTFYNNLNFFESKIKLELHEYVEVKFQSLVNDHQQKLNLNNVVNSGFPSLQMYQDEVQVIEEQQTSQEEQSNSQELYGEQQYDKQEKDVDFSEKHVLFQNTISDDNYFSNQGANYVNDQIQSKQFQLQDQANLKQQYLAQEYQIEQDSQQQQQQQQHQRGILKKNNHIKDHSQGLSEQQKEQQSQRKHNTQQETLHNSSSSINNSGYVPYPHKNNQIKEKIEIIKQSLEVAAPKIRFNGNVQQGYNLNNSFKHTAEPQYASSQQSINENQYENYNLYKDYKDAFNNSNLNGGYNSNRPTLNYVEFSTPQQKYNDGQNTSMAQNQSSQQPNQQTNIFQNQLPYNSPFETATASNM